MVGLLCFRCPYLDKFVVHERNAAAARRATRAAAVSSESGQAANVGATTSRTMCFVAGTPVLTTEGLVPIEEVTVRTRVVAHDFESGRWVERPVSETHRSRYEGSLVTITGEDGSEVTATALSVCG